MGYSARLFGGIGIVPPLTWAEVKDSPWRRKNDQSSLVVRINEQWEDTDDGEKVIRTGVAIDDAWLETEARHSNVDGELRDIVMAFPGHTFPGQFIRVGEHQGDIERYRVDDGVVVTEKAIVTWPGGDKVEQIGY